MKNEYRLFLELSKFIHPDKDKIERLLDETLDMPVVLGHLMYNRMGGVAYHTLETLELLGRVNREFRNVLKTEYSANCAKTDSFYTALNGLCEMLDGAPFKYAFLKGSYLGAVYPKGLRTSNDIDILIKQEDISKLSNLLKQNGFSQGHLRNGRFAPAARKEIVESRMNRGETIPFVKPISMPGMEFCEVDVNFSLDYKAVQKTDIVAHMLNNTVREPGIPPTLSGIDFLIQLCVHLHKEATTMAWVVMGRDLSLYKFCDIYLLIHKWLDDKFCREFKYRAYEYNLQKECYYALHYTKILFDIDSQALDRLLEWLKPVSTAYLKEVIDPGENKIYRYRESFIEWFFSARRKEMLYDAENEESSEEWFSHYIMRSGW